MTHAQQYAKTAIEALIRSYSETITLGSLGTDDAGRVWYLFRRGHADPMWGGFGTTSLPQMYAIMQAKPMRWRRKLVPDEVLPVPVAMRAARRVLTRILESQLLSDEMEYVFASTMGYSSPVSPTVYKRRLIAVLTRLGLTPTSFIGMLDRYAKQEGARLPAHTMPNAYAEAVFTSEIVGH